MSIRGTIQSRRGKSENPAPKPAEDPRGPVLVLGLGNTLLRDDAIGILVAREIGRILGSSDGVEVREASIAGFDLLDLLSGFSRAFVIDAIKTPGGVPGTLYRLQPQDLPASKRLVAIHEINLPTALVLGRMTELAIPEEVVIYAVEVEDDRTFGEDLSAPVARALQPAAAHVAEEIRSLLCSPDERALQKGALYEKCEEIQ